MFFYYQLKTLQIHKTLLFLLEYNRRQWEPFSNKLIILFIQSISILIFIFFLA